MRIRSLIPVILLTFFFHLAFSYTDESHFSHTFKSVRFFRVFTPPDYNPHDSTKRYPVVYYFHGCGGSYRSSGRYSYADYGLAPPVVPDRPPDPEYDYPNNADFEHVVRDRDVIIVCVDGKIPGLPDCGVYFPSLSKGWTGDYYNFSAYIRELVEVVDQRYNTRVGPRYRAISGLSMGGHTAIWLAAANPHLFSSASEFCHSPQFYDVGESGYSTTMDVRQLWRNLKGLPFRHTTTDRDYLRYYTDQLYSTYSGAGFLNEYYLAEWCNHWAARIDLQFDFHLDHFMTAPEELPCFSYVNLYPSFEIRDYHVSTSKKGNGWIYLRDVSKNGMGILTRERLPWGKALPEFEITVTTPPVYVPCESYSVNRFSYRDGRITTQLITSGPDGRLSITSSGGRGEEIGITGRDLQPPIVVLTDTVNENIYLDPLVETVLSFDVVNLSASSQTVEFSASSSNPDLLTFIKRSGRVTIPALSRVPVDSMVVCQGNFLPDYRNVGYLKIGTVTNGKKLEKEHLFQVTVVNRSAITELTGIKVFDGRSENLPLFKYAWNQWEDPLTTGVVSEGSGNGNGIPEQGELFSIWIRPCSALDSRDTSTWHPTIPVNNRQNPDVLLEKVEHHSFNTGRPVLSAQMRLTRKPERNNPVRIPLQAEFLKAQHLEDDCHRNSADQFKLVHFDLLLFEDGTISRYEKN